MAETPTVAPGNTSNLAALTHYLPNMEWQLKDFKHRFNLKLDNFGSHLQVLRVLCQSLPGHLGLLRHQAESLLLSLHTHRPFGFHYK